MDDEVSRLFHDVFQLDAGFQLEPGMSFDDVPGWDSIGHMNLVNEIESRFGVSLEMDVIINLDSVQAVQDIIKESG